MDRDDLRAIIKITDYVIKEHPVWLEETLDITEERTGKVTRINKQSYNYNDENTNRS